MLFDKNFGLTLLRCVFLAEWLLPYWPGAIPQRSVTAVLALCVKLCAFHSVHHPSCPHRRCGGRRLSRSCMAFPVATQHFSRFSFARRRRLCRCPDSVCDTLIVLRVVLPHAPDHAELAALQQVQREAARARRGRKLIEDPASSLVSSAGLPLLPLQEHDWVRPERHCWP